MGLGVRAARYLTASPTRSAAIGAGVGAAASGVAGDPNQSLGQRLTSGALAGGVAGGVGGGLGRMYRDTRLLNPKLTGAGAAGATVGRMGKSVLNFGRRQVYGLTGVGNPNAIGMAGNVAAKREAKLLGLRAKDELRHARGGAKKQILADSKADIKETLRAGRASQSLQDAGVTSLPGAAKALLSGKTRGKALKAMGRSMRDGPGGLKASLGLPALVYGPSLARGDESAQGGHTMGQKLRRAAVGVSMGTAFGGMPLVPQALAGEAADYGYERASKAFKRRRAQGANQ